MRDLIVLIVVLSNAASFVIGRVTTQPRVVYPQVVPGVSFVQPADILQCPRTKHAMELWDSACHARTRSARIHGKEM